MTKILAFVDEMKRRAVDESSAAGGMIERTKKIATKFFEHFLHIAEAMNHIGGNGVGLWDEEDQFFYDVLHLPDVPGRSAPPAPEGVHCGLSIPR